MLIFFAFILSMLSIHAKDNIEKLNIQIITEQQAQLLSIVEPEIQSHGVDSYVCKVTDGKNLFILKQIKDPSEEQFQLIIDCVFSTLAQKFNIPTNTVTFIPYNIAPHIKKYKNQAATLHSFIEGIDLETSLPSFLPENFTIEQRFRKRKQETEESFEKIKGFTVQTIQNMSLHKDLPTIAAFDTFIANYDRNNSNLMYNKNFDHVYAVDQALAFSGKRTFSLPLRAIETITALQQQNYFSNCPANMIQSLKLYKTTLENLYNQTSITMLTQAIDLLFPLLLEGVEKNEEFINTRQFKIGNIKYNIPNVQKLITLLNTLSFLN